MVKYFCLFFALFFSISIISNETIIDLRRVSLENPAAYEMKVSKDFFDSFFHLSLERVNRSYAYLVVELKSPCTENKLCRHNHSLKEEKRKEIFPDPTQKVLFLKTLSSIIYNSINSYLIYDDKINTLFMLNDQEINSFKDSEEYHYITENLEILQDIHMNRKLNNDEDKIILKFPINSTALYKRGFLESVKGSIRKEFNNQVVYHEYKSKIKEKETYLLDIDVLRQDALFYKFNNDYMILNKAIRFKKSLDSIMSLFIIPEFPRSTSGIESLQVKKYLNIHKENNNLGGIAYHSLEQLLYCSHKLANNKSINMGYDGKSKDLINAKGLLFSAKAYKEGKQQVNLSETTPYASILELKLSQQDSAIFGNLKKSRSVSSYHQDTIQRTVIADMSNQGKKKSKLLKSGVHLTNNRASVFSKKSIEPITETSCSTNNFQHESCNNIIWGTIATFESVLGYYGVTIKASSNFTSVKRGGEATSSSYNLSNDDNSLKSWKDTFDFNGEYNKVLNLKNLMILDDLGYDVKDILLNSSIYLNELDHGKWLRYHKVNNKKSLLINDIYNNSFIKDGHLNFNILAKELENKYADLLIIAENSNDEKSLYEGTSFYNPTKEQNLSSGIILDKLYLNTLKRSKSKVEFDFGYPLGLGIYIKLGFTYKEESKDITTFINNVKGNLLELSKGLQTDPKSGDKSLTFERVLKLISKEKSLVATGNLADLIINVEVIFESWPIYLPIYQFEFSLNDISPSRLKALNKDEVYLSEQVNSSQKQTIFSYDMKFSSKEGFKYNNFIKHSGDKLLDNYSYGIQQIENDGFLLVSIDTETFNENDNFSKICMEDIPLNVDKDPYIPTTEDPVEDPFQYQKKYTCEVNLETGTDYYLKMTNLYKQLHNNPLCKEAGTLCILNHGCENSKSTLNTQLGLISSVLKENISGKMLCTDTYPEQEKYRQYFSNKIVSEIIDTANKEKENSCVAYAAQSCKCERNNYGLCSNPKRDYCKESNGTWSCESYPSICGECSKSEVCNEDNYGNWSCVNRDSTVLNSKKDPSEECKRKIANCFKAPEIRKVFNCDINERTSSITCKQACYYDHKCLLNNQAGCLICDEPVHYYEIDSSVCETNETPIRNACSNMNNVDKSGFEDLRCNNTTCSAGPEENLAACSAPIESIHKDYSDSVQTGYNKNAHFKDCNIVERNGVSPQIIKRTRYRDKIYSFFEKNGIARDRVILNSQYQNSCNLRQTIRE